jgi:hypothetical protein
VVGSLQNAGSEAETWADFWSGSRLKQLDVNQCETPRSALFLLQGGVDGEQGEHEPLPLRSDALRTGEWNYIALSPKYNLGWLLGIVENGDWIALDAVPARIRNCIFSSIREVSSCGFDARFSACTSPPRNY